MGAFRKFLSTRTFSYIVVFVVAISFYLIFSNFFTVSNVLSSALSIISPFLYAIALAYILNSPITWFKTKVFHKIKYKNQMSVLIVYILFFLIVIGLIVAVLPEIADTFYMIANQLPGVLTNINDLILKYKDEFHISTEITEQLTTTIASLTTTITNYLMNLAPILFNASISAVSIVVQIITALISSVYILLTKDKLVFQCKKFLFAFIDVNIAHKVMYISNKCNRIFSGFIIGKLIDSAIIGVITFFAMLFIYPPYAVLFAIIIGLTNVIPYFGPFIGAIPCSLLLLMVSPKTMLVFIIFILVLQQIDGNIIGAKILGNSTGISPIWVLIAIIVGGGLFGFVGMFMGIPTFAVIYELVSEVISNRLKKREITYSDSLNMIIIPDDENSKMIDKTE